MSTWWRGRHVLLRSLERDTYPLSDFIRQMHTKTRVPGTAVYLTSRLDMVPVPLLHNLKHNKVLHQRIVLMHIVTENVPRIAHQERIRTADLGDNFYSIRVCYGFMEQPNMPKVLEDCRAHEIIFNMMDTSFFVGRVDIVAGRHSRLSGFRRKVFDFMHRNALPATEFFRIPPGRVIELGGQVAM
jgi:KUP system potassium uptake protein